jgi:predicted nucleotidyltransferase
MRPAKEPFKSIVEAVLTVTEPAAVILFGSHARGDACQESDIDLLVIRKNDFKPGESRRKELAHCTGQLLKRVRLRKMSCSLLRASS